jgi:hypothetical protein
MAGMAFLNLAWKQGILKPRRRIAKSYDVLKLIRNDSSNIVEEN